jgi:hypothetical protein
VAPGWRLSPAVDHANRPDRRLGGARDFSGPSLGRVWGGGHGSWEDAQRG